MLCAVRTNGRCDQKRDKAISCLAPRRLVLGWSPPINSSPTWVSSSACSIHATLRKRKITPHHLRVSKLLSMTNTTSEGNLSELAGKVVLVTGGGVWHRSCNGTRVRGDGGRDGHRQLPSVSGRGDGSDDPRSGRTDDVRPGSRDQGSRG